MMSLTCSHVFPPPLLVCLFVCLYAVKWCEQDCSHGCVDCEPRLTLVVMGTGLKESSKIYMVSMVTE